MPRISKYTKAEIVQVGLDLVREYGFDAVTARALATKLGATPRVLFGHFDSMDDVLGAIEEAAKKVYGAGVEVALSQEHPFQAVGMNYIRFAMEEPELFKVLFMSEQAGVQDYRLVLVTVTEHFELIMESIVKEYGVTPTQAERIYHHLWIYTHGIATMLVSQMCQFTAQEIGELVTEEFLAIYQKVRK